MDVTVKDGVILIVAAKRVRGKRSLEDVGLDPKRWSRKKALKILEGARRSGLGGIRLSVQLHKVYGLR